MGLLIKFPEMASVDRRKLGQRYNGLSLAVKIWGMIASNTTGNHRAQITEPDRTSVPYSSKNKKLSLEKLVILN